MYLLDTSVCIHLLNERHNAIEQHFRSHSPTDIALCSVVKAELLFGARHSQRVSTNLQRLIRKIDLSHSLHSSFLEKIARIRKS